MATLATKGCSALLLCVLWMMQAQVHAISCSSEASIKQKILSALRAAPKEMPKFVRGVFHDSTDRNNLAEKSGGRWTKISGTYGGVDGCLYAPLAKGGKATGKVGGRKGGKSKSKSKRSSSS